MSTKLNITLSQLEALLRRQSEVAAEHVYNNLYKKAHPEGPEKTPLCLAKFANEGRNTPLPNEIQILKKFID